MPVVDLQTAGATHTIVPGPSNSAASRLLPWQPLPPGSPFLLSFSRAHFRTGRDHATLPEEKFRKLRALCIGYLSALRFRLWGANP